jgi:hypothetical protein
VVVALGLVTIVVLGVHDGGFNGWIRIPLIAIHLLILLDLLALEGLVVLLVTPKACHGCSLFKLLHFVLMVILRMLDILHSILTIKVG